MNLSVYSRDKHTKLQLRKIQLEAEYRTLSELWEPKSMHHTHIKIGNMLDEVIKQTKQNNIELTSKKVKIPIELFAEDK